MNAPFSVPPGGNNDPWLRSYLDTMRMRFENDLRAALLANIEALDDIQALLATSELGDELHLDPLRIARDRLLQRLVELGVAVVPTSGQRVDPTFHCVEHVIDDPAPAGTILHELRPGYTYRGQLLRPALVATAK